MRTFLCSLRTDPAPLGRMGRSAGSVLRALRKLEGEGAFALCARDFGVRFQGSLRTDPAPLGYFLECGPSLAGRLGVGEALALKRPGKVDRLQCSLRTDPAPLGYFLECGPSLAEEALGVGAFALCGRDFSVRFQGSLRTDPARRVALSYPGLGLRGAAMDGLVWTVGAGERRSLHAW